MKKYFFSLVLLAGLVGLIEAGQRTVAVPNSEEGTPLAVSDFVGMDYGLSSFSLTHSTGCAPCAGSFAGVVFSSGINSEYVDVFDSTHTSIISASQSIGRYYNVANSTAGANSIGSGFSGPKYPIRFNNGLIWKPSVATYNSIVIEFWSKDR